MITPSHHTTKPALVILGLTFGIIALSAFVPASWFGIAPQTVTKEYDLSMLQEESTPDAKNPAKPTSNWRELLQKNYNEVAADIPQPEITDEEQKKIDAQLNDPNNLTASFMKNSYVASAYLKENNITDEKIQTEMIHSLVDQEKEKIVVKVYTQKDIHIANKETKTTIFYYGNALGAEMKKADTYKLGDTDIKDLQSYSDSKDSKHLAALAKKRDGLANTIKALLAMQVPPSASSYHILALNKLSEYYTTLDNFAKAEEDPLRASIALKEYLPNLRSLFGALNAMRGYFRDSGIVYSKNDPGYVFSAVNATQ